jgi:hypothetical protein
MSVLPKHTVQNKHQRMTFIEWAKNNEVSFNIVRFPDEAHLHLDGVVNKQNVLLWTPENPRVIHENVHHAPRITVWVAISSHGLLWPIFFEETVNSDRYLSMLRNTFLPHLLAIGLSLQTQWFMQNGARSHTANVVLNFLHDTSDLRVISNQFPDRFSCGQNWPTNNPDLNPRDYFFDDSLRKKISEKSRKQ